MGVFFCRLTVSTCGIVHSPVQAPLQIIIHVLFCKILFEYFQQLPSRSGPWLAIYFPLSVLFFRAKNTSFTKYGRCMYGSHLPVQAPLQIIIQVMFCTLLFKHFQQLPWCSGPWLGIYLPSSTFFFSSKKIAHLLNIAYVWMEVIFQYKHRYK